MLNCRVSSFLFFIQQVLIRIAVFLWFSLVPPSCLLSVGSLLSKGGALLTDSEPSPTGNHWHVDCFLQISEPWSQSAKLMKAFLLTSWLDSWLCPKLLRWANSVKNMLLQPDSSCFSEPSPSERSCLHQGHPWRVLTSPGRSRLHPHLGLSTQSLPPHRAPEICHGLGMQPPPLGGLCDSVCPSPGHLVWEIGPLGVSNKYTGPCGLRFRRGSSTWPASAYTLSLLLSFPRATLPPYWNFSILKEVCVCVCVCVCVFVLRKKPM